MNSAQLPVGLVMGLARVRLVVRNLRVTTTGCSPAMLDPANLAPQRTGRKDPLLASPVRQKVIQEATSR